MENQKLFIGPLSYNPIPKTTISPDHLKYTSHLCGQMQDERKP